MRLLRSVLAAWLVSAVAQAQDPARTEDCGLEPPGTPKGLPVPAKPFERRVTAQTAPLVRREDPAPTNARAFGLPSSRSRQGALSGKTVYLSPGHGLIYVDALGGYGSQRPNTNTIVEDIVSNETVSQFLIPLLTSAGATVRPAREPDPNPRMVIVDDGSPSYAESGNTGLFTTSTLPGFGPPPATMSDGIALFQSGQNRLLEAAATATAQAVYTADIPESGYYNVYVTYTQFTGRVDDAHYVVRHPGGEAHFRVNQQRHGSTWVLLGRFYFAQGKDAAKGALVVLNDSKNPAGRNLSLDAVRFGGGMGFNYDRGRGSTGRPRFDEAGRLGTQWFGAPQSAFDNPSLTDRDDDIQSRPKYAKWDHEPGEPAVYVAWHTNAPTPVTGTTTYIYGAEGPGVCKTPTPTAGSQALANAVHGELVRDARAGWLPSWSDKGIQCAYFGELSPSANDEMPSVLIEVAFHDTPADALHLKEPPFRYLAARAIAQGIIKYFAQADGVPARLPPEPPAVLQAVNIGAGRIQLRWEPVAKDGGDLAGDVATGYRVYQSADGLSWDEGTETAQKELAVQLSPGQTRYFRVGATNEGGESLPSEAVGVRAAAGVRAPVLVVSGFTRWDATGALLEDMSRFGLGSPVRAFMERVNDGASVRRHGDAFAALSLPFDGATSAAFGAGATVGGYTLIDWVGGRGTPGGGALEVAERQRLAAFITAGGNLLFSSAQAAAALSAGSAEDKAFLADVLHAAVAARLPLALPDGGSMALMPADALLDAVGRARVDDGTRGSYAGVREIEFLAPAGGRVTAQMVGTRALGAASGGKVIGTFEGTTSAAIISSGGEGGGRVAFVGFPIETLSEEAPRRKLIAQLVGFLAPGIGDVATDGGVVFPEVDSGVVTLPDGGTARTLPAIPLVEGSLAETGCGCASALDGAWLMLVGALLPLLRRGRRRSVPSVSNAEDLHR